MNKDDLKKEIRIVASRARTIAGLEESGRRWVDLFIKKGIVEKGMRVLDFGAGLGRLSIPLHRAGIDVVALERRTAMVEYLINRGIVVRSGEDMRALSGEHFDVVIAAFVFQHMGKKRAMELICQAAKISDVLYFTIPTTSFYESHDIENPYIIEVGQSDRELFVDTECSYCYKDEDVPTLIEGSDFSKVERVDMKNVDMFKCTK